MRLLHADIPRVDESCSPPCFLVRVADRKNSSLSCILRKRYDEFEKLHSKLGKPKYGFPKKGPSEALRQGLAAYLARIFGDGLTEDAQVFFDVPLVEQFFDKLAEMETFCTLNTQAKDEELDLVRADLLSTRQELDAERAHEANAGRGPLPTSLAPGSAQQQVSNGVGMPEEVQAELEVRLGSCAGAQAVTTGVGAAIAQEFEKASRAAGMSHTRITELEAELLEARQQLQAQQNGSDEWKTVAHKEQQLADMAQALAEAPSVTWESLGHLPSRESSRAESLTNVRRVI